MVSSPPPYDFQASALSNNGTSFVGTDYSYFVEIENTGTNNDTYDLSLAGNSWTTVIRDKNDASTITTLAVNSGAVDTFMVKVSVPLSATLLEKDTAAITVTSQGASANTVNDTVVTTAIAPVTSYPYLEDFEAGALAWTNLGSPAGEFWRIDVPGNGANPAEYAADYDHTTGSGHIAWIDDSFSHNADSCVFLSPVLDLTSLTNAYLEFWYWIGKGAAGTSEMSIAVYNGTTWTVIDTVTGSVDDWEQYVVDITPYKSATTQIAFIGYEDVSGYSQDISLDDIQIYEPLAYDFSAISLDNDGVGFVGTDYSYLVEISNTGTNNDTYDLSLAGNSWTTVIRDKNDASTISTLAVNSGAVDTFMVKVSIPAAAALGDMDSVTYTITSQGNTSMIHDSKLYTTAFAPIQAPYTETLEDNSPYRDIAWQISNTSPTWDLYLGTRYPAGYDAHSGDYLVYFNSFSVSSGTSRVFGLFDLATSTNTELRYWMFKNDGYSTSVDSLQAQVSYDGMTWTNVGPSEMRYDANGNAWHEIIVDLSAYDGDTIWVGIEGGSDYGHDIHIDDIYVGPKPPAELIFTEIMYNPPEFGTDSLEFVEIFNNSDLYSVQMQNYTLNYHTNGAIHTFGDIVLGPQEYICIAKDSAVFHDFYGIIAEEMNGPGSFSGFSNSGNRPIWIEDASGMLIDSVYYDDGGAWPTEPDDHGPSLVLCDYTLDNNLGSNWTYSKMYVDTLLPSATAPGGDTVWASPGAKDNACFIYDIAFSQPPATHGNDFYFCELPSIWNIDFMIENNGNMAIPAGDTIFASYQIDANPVVLDTFVLSSDIDTAAFAGFTFTQAVDLSVDGDYDYILTINYEKDINLLNDTSTGTLHNFVVDANLPGYNDTLYVSSYPATIDAGSTTSSGWSYSAWDWSTTETTPTIDVSADGWYYVTVTTAKDSMDNNCTAVDSVYVILGTGVQEYQVGMSVYPNPNQGSFTVVFEGNTASSVLSIMDITGRIIREEELNGDAVMQVDMTAEPKGIYFIRISNEQSIKMERIIIQ
jgi:hypothetical protein